MTLLERDREKIEEGREEEKKRIEIAKEMLKNKEPLEKNNKVFKTY